MCKGGGLWGVGGGRGHISHYLNWCLHIVNWTLRNKLQRIFHWNWYIFIQENAFEIAICKMVAILSQPQYVKSHWSEFMSLLWFNVMLLATIPMGINIYGTAMFLLCIPAMYTLHYMQLYAIKKFYCRFSFAGVCHPSEHLHIYMIYLQPTM